MPLLPGVTCLDQNGAEIWVSFQYERLGELCYRCVKITHPTSRCPKPTRPSEDCERPAEDSYGPWMRAKEIFGKHYPAKKQIPMDMQEEQMEPDKTHTMGGETKVDAISSQHNTIMTRSANKKRKAVEEDLASPIKENARRAHTGVMNMVAELITDLHDASPIHTSASKPSWKKMARTTKVKYQPSTIDLIQAFDMEAEGRGKEQVVGQQQVTDGGVPAVPSLGSNYYRFSLVFPIEVGGY
ncbi:hypothetical protein Tsubulata_024528 [Turnera subulata]|uniref:Zinc knuckle CX2CX4HX4C domain-containing protein n=1 Tax=Turnera subulata TaxID=218843 RepID=A0A9Q0FD29_9ROSI|nr:hypothetical protein Tsubulata_024528 [Turnera subulata]